MNIENVLSNKSIPIHLRRWFEAQLQINENPLFSIVGDLSLNSDYGNSALLITDSRLLYVDDCNPNDSFFMPINTVKTIKVTRMYSNASLTINGKIVMRFSFSIVSIMEVVSDYISKVADGSDYITELKIVTNTIDNLRCFCPKCGRALIRPGAECINCVGKTKLINKLWKYVAPQKYTLILCLLLSVITTTTALVPPYITKLLVDDVIPKHNLKLLYILVSTLLAVQILQCCIGALRSYKMRIAGDNIVTFLRNDVYKKAQYLPSSFYDKTSTGSMFSRISGDTNTLNEFMLRISQEAIVQLFLMIGIMVIMFVLNWKLALLSLIPVPLVAIGARTFRKKIQPVYRKIWIRWSSVCGVLSDSLPGIRVIKAFTGEKRAISKFESYNKSWFKEDSSAASIGSIFPQAVSFFVTCGSLIIWGIGGHWVITNPTIMSTGLLVSFISYASMFYGPVNFFANLSDSYSRALTSVERLLDILDSEPEKDFGKGNLCVPFEGKIEFKNVTFSFDKTIKTLNNINLTINPGDVVGVVGTTGSGKSTLINLIMRFYDDYDGEILVDGNNIKNIDLQNYRSQIGFVQQEPLMFRDTIYNNIAFSNPDLPVEAVINAADIANAHSFISRMPDAYDTVLGERGSGLSGGERQRISIARAVIKNPSILIFDEATAAVDSETEHLIQEAIERLIRGRTTIMIAHRLSTLKKANKIVVVDKGKIIECGTPDELIKQKGKYFKLLEIQSMSETLRQKSEEERFTEVI